MPAHGGEIQLTDALRVLTRKRGMYACEFEGTGLMQEIRCAT